MWLKLAQWFWRRIFFNYVKIFSLLSKSSLFGKDVVLHLNKLEFPSPKEAVCQVWLKLAQWFWRQWKCETLTDRRTDDGRQAIRKAQLSFSWDKLKGKHIPIPNEDIKRFLLISNLHSQESWISQWYAMFRQKFLSAVLTCNLTCFHFSMHGCFWFGM